MIDTPKISVILPVYNCQEFVYEAVNSVLNQTYGNFELIIIDDCSTDNTLEIIKSFNDSRIKIIEKSKNSGYTDSLNQGIKISKGEFIARMDGDDICLPDRFEKQIHFLEKNKDIILCGTGIKIIDTDKILKHPLHNNEILVKLCFGTSFYHPTIMARKTFLLDNPYDRKFEPAEDYNLWTRLAFLGRLANLDEVLLMYRVHPNQISNSKNEIQLNNAFLCRLIMLNHLQITQFFSDNDIKAALQTPYYNSISDLKKALNFYNYLIQKNNSILVFNKEIFNKKIQKIRINILKLILRNSKFDYNLIFFCKKELSIKDILVIFKIKGI